MHRALSASAYAVLELHERDVRMEDFLDLATMQAICERQLGPLPGDPTVHAQLGAVLQAEGRYGEALAEFRTAHQLGGQQPGWRRPSALWLERARRWAALEIAMQRALDERGEPRDAVEAEAFARIAYRKGIFDASARWFAQALATRKDGEVGEFTRLEAVCAALRVAAPSSAAERDAWRARARAWLADDLDSRERQLGEGRPAAITARRVLGAWRIVPELAEAQGPEWRELLDRAAGLAQRAAEAVSVR
jgi:tetratricopeptide (TPR) repeat protein